MTMATLSEKSIPTTCILPTPTCPHRRLVSNESIVSIRTTSTTSTTSYLCQSAALRDSPTTVPTTAASSGVDDDDRPRSDSSPAPMKEAPTALPQTFLQEWNAFYREFVNSDNYKRYVKPHNETAVIDAAADDELAQLQLTATAAPQTTHPHPCRPLKQSIPSIRTPLPALPSSSPHLSPSDSPTTVKMPAAPSATANEPLRSTFTRQSSPNVAPPMICTHAQHGVYNELRQPNRKIYQNETPEAVLSVIATAADDRSTNPNGTPPSTDAIIDDVITRERNQQLSTTATIPPRLMQATGRESKTNNLQSNNDTNIALAPDPLPWHHDINLDQSDPRGIAPATPVPLIPSATTTCPERSDPLNEVFHRMNDKLDRLFEQSQRHYAIMAKTNQQMLAHLQELVQLTPLFLASVSTYHYDPEPSQQHDNLKRPANATTLANSQIQPWTTVASLPLSIVATASIHATNHVMKASMASSPVHHQPLNYTTRSRRLPTSLYLTQRKTPDMFNQPMKHVRFKTTALCSPGPRMFWPKEDMRPP